MSSAIVALFVLAWVAVDVMFGDDAAQGFMNVFGTLAIVAPVLLACVAVCAFAWGLLNPASGLNRAERIRQKFLDEHPVDYDRRFS